MVSLYGFKLHFLTSNDVHMPIFSREVSVHIFCLLLLLLVSLLLLRFLYTFLSPTFCHICDLLIFFSQSVTFHSLSWFVKTNIFNFNEVQFIVFFFNWIEVW